MQREWYEEGWINLWRATTPDSIERSVLYDKFLKDNGGRIRGACARLVGRDSPDLDDIYGEAVIVVLRALDSFDPHLGVPFGVFAFRCIVNSVRDWFRKTKNRLQTIQIEILGERDLDSDQQGHEYSPEKLTQRQALKQVIWEAVASLPDRDRLIWQMHFRDGNTWSEIGERTKLPPSTASSRISSRPVRRWLVEFLMRRGYTAQDLWEEMDK